MNTYIYCADLYCEDCADEIKSRILADVTARLNPKIDAAIRRLENDLGIKVSDKTWERINDRAIKAAMPDPDNCDSGEYPRYAGADGGGESDSPQYCGSCHEFLENPLTADGTAYIRENQCGEWDSFYGVSRPVIVVRHATAEVMFECDTVEQAKAWINERAKTDDTVERGEYVIDAPEVAA